MTLEHFSLPPGVNISYESQCGGSEETEGEAGDRGQCNHVRINQTVRAGQDRQKEGGLPCKSKVVFHLSFLRGFSEWLPQVSF